MSLFDSLFHKDTRLIKTDMLDEDGWRRQMRNHTPLYSLKKILGKDNGWWVAKRCTPKKSLLTAAKIFDHIGGKTIIEVGSGIQGEFSGNSVLVWLQTNAQHIFCLDLDEDEIKKVKNTTKKDKRINALVQDGLKFVKDFNGTIDLLYLDFWQPSAEKRASAYAKIFVYAKDKMSDTSMILIDDTDHGDPWKQTYIVPKACREGYRVAYIGRQTLLFRGEYKDIDKLI